MSVDKTRVKVGALFDVGAHVDDVKEFTQKEYSRSEGAIAAYETARSAIHAINGHVDKDVSNGEYDLEVAAKVKRYLARAEGVVTSLLQAAVSRRAHVHGELEGLSKAIEVIKKHHNLALAQQEALEKPLVPAVPDAEGRPLSVKQRRLLEDEGPSVQVFEQAPPIAAPLPSSEAPPAEQAAPPAAAEAQSPVEEDYPVRKKRRKNRAGLCPEHRIAGQGP